EADLFLQARLDAFEHLEHFLQARRFVAFPVLLRGQANARAVGAATVVRAAEGASAVPRGGDQFGYTQAAVEQGLLQLGNFLVAQGVVDARYRVLPAQVFLRHVRAQVAALRAEVAVRQLEPGTRKPLVEVRRILVDALGNLAIFR